MYEVEIKVEVSEEEVKRLISRLSERGFSKEGTVLQRDFYTKAVESLHNAFDIERYRDEGGKYLYTKKAWEVENGEPIRKEEEHEIAREEFEQAIEKFPDCIKILKSREYFVGFFETNEVTISVDSIKFDHSSSIRYFLEAEVMVEERILVAETRKFLFGCIAELLGVEESKIVEAPGMFAMAYKML